MTQAVRILGGILVAAAALATAPAGAADLDTSFHLFDTVRVGAFAHNPGLNESGDVDVSAHVITSPIATSTSGNALVDFFLSPRLHAGAMINTEGHTSYGYAGLTWRAALIGAVFTELEFGGAVNNYKAHTDDRIDMGCHVTFRESVGLGYRFSEHFDVIASVEHASHANLCSERNAGVTNVGVRVGYRF